MKWIGQHIYDFISRFRSKVYLEDVDNAGSDTDAFLVKKADGEVAIRTGDQVLSDLGVSSGEILDWTTDQGGTNIHTENIHDLHGAGVSGNVNSLLTDGGDGSIISNSDLLWQADQLTLISSTSGKPKIALANSNDDSIAPVIEFSKTPLIMADPGDNDEIGKITYTGLDHNDNGQTYANIIVHSKDVTDTDEAGGMKLQVATEGTLQQVLTAIGDGASSKVDIGLAYGAASTTTVAGNLIVTSDLTVSGTTTTINTTNLNVEDKNITLNYHDSSDTSGTADGAGITIQDAVDASTDASLSWSASTDNWRLSHGLDVENPTDGGVPALVIDNNDVDENAIYIGAENTTADIIHIDAQDLTTGSAIFVDSHSTGQKELIKLDVDTPGNVNNEYITGMMMDIDKTGNVAGGENSWIHGLDINYNDTGTDTGNSIFRGIQITSQSANDSGINTRYGIHLMMTGGDAIGTIGVRSKIENGGYDFRMESSAEYRDYCLISTGANGLTTIQTNDYTTGSEADLVLDIDGEIVLDAHTGEDIFFKENGTERIHWHLDASPSMEVTGNFDIDGSGDVKVDSATGNFNFLQSGNQCAFFDYNTSTNSSMLSLGNGTSSGAGIFQVTESTGDWNGNLLTITGGDALDGTGNNRSGGDVIIKGGKGTGSARTGTIEFQLREAGGTSGTAERSPETAFKMSAIKATLSTPTMNKFTIFEPGEDADEYCRITVADQGVSTIETHDDTGSNGGNLTLDIDGDIALDAHTNKDIYFKENGTERFQFHLDSSPTMEVTGSFDLDCSGSITLDSATNNITLNSSDVTANTDTFTMVTDSSARPLMTLENRNANPNPSLLKFYKNVTGDGLDFIGSTGWVAKNAADQDTTYAEMYTQIKSGGHVDGDEAGIFQISVAASDDSNSNLRRGLILEGHTTADTVNATLGYGNSSSTTIAGDLTVTGNDIYGPSAGYLALQADADIHFAIDVDNNQSSSFYWYANGYHGSKHVMSLSDAGELLVGGYGAPNAQITIYDVINDANGPLFIFKKERTNIAGGDPSVIYDASNNDVLGTIQFKGYDDGTPSEQVYAVIQAKIADAESGKEAGKLSFYVTEFDGTDTTAGLVLDGDTNADGEIDVTIGAGAASITTIAGDLDIDGDNVTAAGALTITPGGAFSVAGGSSEIDLTTSGTVDINAGTLDIDATNVSITGTSNVIDGKTSITRRQFSNPSDGAGNADGDVIYIGTNDGGAGGDETQAGAVYFYHSNGSWVKTDADDPSTATGLLAVALGTDPDADGMLLRGTVDLAINIVGTEALGSILYLDKVTAGAITTAAPTATGDIVRVIGYALSVGDTNKIWFNPDNTWVEHV